MEITLESLGLTKEDLAERIVDRACEQLLSESGWGEDGEETRGRTALANRLIELVKKQIDAKVAQIAEVHILPKVSEYVENISLQETNKWGEKTAKPVTFIEYLVARADSYLREDVDYEGRGKSERDGYSWTKSQTRITYLVNKHLHYSIETAMKTALASANSAIVGGIEEAVKFKLAEVQKAIQVTVKSR